MNPSLHRPSSSSLFFLALLATTLAMDARPAVADPGKEDGPLVKPVTELTQELVDDVQADYLFPLQVLPRVDLASLKVGLQRPIDVAQGQVHSSALLGAFQLSLDCAGERPVLKVHVDFKRLSHAATYEVLLSITGKVSAPSPSAPESAPKGSDQTPSGTPPAGPELKQQTMTIKLVHPEGQLRLATGPLVIERNQQWLRPDEIFPPELQLTEQTGRTLVTVKRFSVIDGPTQEERHLAAGLSPRLPVTVPAGLTVPASFTLWGDFPPGTSKGSLQLEADQLKTPLLVPYEVHRRLYWGWVPLLFLLASGLGWFVRTYLKSRQEFLALQSQASELLERLDALRRRSPDSAALELADPASRLERCFDSKDPKVLADAIKAADEALGKALAQRTKLRQDLLAGLEQSLDAIRQSVTLPAELQHPCDAVGQRLEAARQALLQDDLREMKKCREQVDPLLRELWRASIEWAESVQSSLGMRAVLAPANNPPPPDERVKRVSEALDRVVQLRTTPLGAVETILRPLSSAIDLGGMLARQLRDELRDTVEACITALQLPSDSEHTTRLRSVVAVEVSSVNLKATFAALTAAASGLHKAVGEVLKALYPDLLANDRQIAELLSKSEYEAAIRLAQSTRSFSRGAEVAPAGAQPRATRTLAQNRPAANEQQGPAPSHSLVVLANAPTPLEVLRARTTAELARATVLRTIGYMLLSTVLATLVYGPKFVGTWTEIGGLFAFGFGADFTVGTVLEDLLGKMKK